MIVYRIRCYTVVEGHEPGRFSVGSLNFTSENDALAAAIRLREDKRREVEFEGWWFECRTYTGGKPKYGITYKDLELNPDSPEVTKRWDVVKYDTDLHAVVP